MTPTLASNAVRSSSRDDLYTAYRAALLSPAQVRELSAIRWYRPVLDTLWCWLWIVAAWGAVAIWPRAWVIAAAVVVIAARFYALFIIAHDGFHRRLMKRAWVNDLFTDACILGSIGAITRLNCKNHLLHHRHLATAADPDRHKYGCFNKATPRQLIGYLTGTTSFFRSMRHAFLQRGRSAAVGPSGSGEASPTPETAAAPSGVKTSSSTAPAALGESKSDRYRLRDVVILLAWQGALFGGLTYGFGWWGYPLLWFVPVYGAFLLDNLRSFCEHSHPEADAKADRHRLITYRSHPLERLLLAPMNMNYHAVHHLWPSIPYYRLPVADRLIRHHPAADGLHWRGSYLAYLWRYYRRLPLVECQSDPSANRDFTSRLVRRRPR